MLLLKFITYHVLKNRRLCNDICNLYCFGLRSQKELPRSVNTLCMHSSQATSAPPTMQADMFRKQASLNQARHRMVNIADMPAYALRQASINSGSRVNNEALLRTASIDRYTADREDVQSIPIDTTHVSINLNPSAARMSWPMSELRGDPSIKR